MSRRKTKYTDEEYKTWIGKRIEKHSGKPFKSGEIVVKVKETDINPNSGKLAFVLEDGSVIDCIMCKLNSSELLSKKGGLREFETMYLPNYRSTYKSVKDEGYRKELIENVNKLKSTLIENLERCDDFLIAYDEMDSNHEITFYEEWSETDEEFLNRKEMEFEKGMKRRKTNAKKREKEMEKKQKLYLQLRKELGYDE